MKLIDHDLHVHTYLSSCCHDKALHRPARILKAAESAGLNTIGFTDHLWVNPILTPSRWYGPQDETQISRLREELARIETKVRVLVGCEAETIAPAMFGITEEFAETLDFVLLACSHFHMNGFVESPPGDRPRDIAVHLRSFFASAVSSGLATGIPHVFLPFGFVEQYDAIIQSLSDAEFLDTFGPAAESGVGIEITTSYFPPAGPIGGRHQWSLETPLRVLELAKRAGCRFYFATDAHDLDSLAELPRLRFFAEALELTEDDLLPIARI